MHGGSLTQLWHTGTFFSLWQVKISAIKKVIFSICVILINFFFGWFSMKDSLIASIVATVLPQSFFYNIPINESNLKKPRFTQNFKLQGGQMQYAGKKISLAVEKCLSIKKIPLFKGRSYLTSTKRFNSSRCDFCFNRKFLSLHIHGRTLQSAAKLWIYI